MMRSSIRCHGLSTVNDLARMWAKLIPSSGGAGQRVSCGWSFTALWTLDVPSNKGGSPSSPPVPNAVHHGCTPCILPPYPPAPGWGVMEPWIGCPSKLGLEPG